MRKMLFEVSELAVNRQPGFRWELIGKITVAKDSAGWLADWLTG